MLSFTVQLYCRVPLKVMDTETGSTVQMFGSKPRYYGETKYGSNQKYSFRLFCWEVILTKHSVNILSKPMSPWKFKQSPRYWRRLPMVSSRAPPAVLPPSLLPPFPSSSLGYHYPIADPIWPYRDPLAHSAYQCTKVPTRSGAQDHIQDPPFTSWFCLFVGVSCVIVFN
jgi:hypothetical protein